jgi:simple sugar transport system permease protein
MVGINEVLGYRYRYYDGFSDNYGFTGIAVALLGRNHPAGVVLAALLFAVLQRGGVPVDAFTQFVSKDIVQILQALVILFVAAEAMFRSLQKGIGGRGKGEKGARQQAPVTRQQATIGKI